jgi:hypothetical protein
MNAMTKPALLGCALLLVAIGRGDQVRAASDAPAAQATPDFSGVWLPNSKESGRIPQERPFTPAIKARREQWTKTNSPTDPVRDDFYGSCLPYTLTYLITTITQYPFEIVATPGRIYFFTETFGQVRRIYLDGTAPREALPSRTGISVGHWEGSQLVVETTNILTQNEGDRYPASPALRVLERFSLQDGGPTGKQLVDEITLVDPLVYEKPMTVRMVYKAASDIQIGEYICEQDLWDQHLAGSTSRIPWR